jgi:hypothetical protein
MYIRNRFSRLIPAVGFRLFFFMLRHYVTLLVSRRIKFDKVYSRRLSQSAFPGTAKILTI